MNFFGCFVTAVAGYLLGSIPTGYLAGLAKGIDIRSVGSGNIGATNVLRILGRKAGALVLTVDALKGWLAVSVLPQIVMQLFSRADWGTSGEGMDYLKIIAGMAAILGHNYTCWLKFKGGKGVATSAGVMLALVPLAFVVSLVTWLALCRLTRYVSVASITAAAVLPVATWAIDCLQPWGVRYSYRLVFITAVMAALVIYKHKGNIQRLMEGTENKIGGKNGPPSTGAGS